MCANVGFSVSVRIFVLFLCLFYSVCFVLFWFVCLFLFYHILLFEMSFFKKSKMKKGCEFEWAQQWEGSRRSGRMRTHI